MKTPEGKVKDKVKEFLHSRKVQSLTHPIEDAIGFYWMPVVGGMGSAFLDFVICYKGRFIAVEAKGPDLRPTPRQCLIADMVEQGGGAALWGCEDVVAYIKIEFDAIDND